MKKLKKEAKCLIYTSIFLGLIFLILLIISLITHSYGLVIGWSIGFFITILSMFLLFKSGELIQSSAIDNGKGAGLVAIFYISRFALYAVGLIMCALAFYTWHCNMFQYSVFTCLCALLPSHIFIAIFYRDNDEPVKKPEETKKEEIKK